MFTLTRSQLLDLFPCPQGLAEVDLAFGQWDTQAKTLQDALEAQISDEYILWLLVSMSRKNWAVREALCAWYADLAEWALIRYGSGKIPEVYQRAITYLREGDFCGLMPLDLMEALTDVMQGCESTFDIEYQAGNTLYWAVDSAYRRNPTFTSQLYWSLKESEGGLVAELVFKNLFIKRFGGQNA